MKPRLLTREQVDAYRRDGFVFPVPVPADQMSLHHTDLVRFRALQDADFPPPAGVHP